MKDNFRQGEGGVIKRLGYIDLYYKAKTFSVCVYSDETSGRTNIILHRIDHQLGLSVIRGLGTSCGRQLYTTEESYLGGYEGML